MGTGAGFGTGIRNGSGLGSGFMSMSFLGTTSQRASKIVFVVDVGTRFWISERAVLRHFPSFERR